jgi:quercetin dioxygenase-like cupin family protein
MWSNSNCKRATFLRNKSRREKIAVRPLVLAGSVLLGSAGVCAQTVPAPELPRPSVEVPGITPEVLSRERVPGGSGKIAIVTRVTYEPGTRVRKHYHTSQVVFYILEGAMVVQDDGKEPTTLKPGDSLFIKPGTVQAHWNASTTGKLVFTEFILVDEGQRSVVFVEQ